MLSPEFVDFLIELLEKHHDRAAFRCGNEQFDRYLQATATQDRKRNIAIPYVVVDRERQKIIGFYTLSMSGVALEQLPPDMAKKLPKYPIVGVTLIGRLAVACEYKGCGWGKLLLMDALYRSLCASKTTASFAIVVDAIDEAAVRFYERFEFQAFPDRPHKLFRTMANVAQAFAMG
ncbi:GNAT family N-acetyltransferase [Synechococcales cyanobacterium C]|uniref:GNAT family N-acetyltransferase n=1 Tax=Petrachloros mirabilis ULC683 TaxID=2781853 RepID=A0A8K1ZW19_9CYAN|nr:GNAT family N-acetyltransferase [Petrachloros mirabilis]NCJ05928.1 GNAT family N-acetyltransferase [Petrachloros mirabilis ULC683]